MPYVYNVRRILRVIDGDTVDAELCRRRIASVKVCECGAPKSLRAVNCRSCAQRKRWGEDDGRRTKLVQRNKAVREGVTPYEDAEWLRARYIDDQMSLRAIAKLCGSKVRTIARWVEAHGIDTRPTGTKTEAQILAAKLRRRDAHWNWKGGRYIQSGYVKVLVPEGLPFEMPADAYGYAFEHRLVMALALGRPLRPDETVHHLDGDRTNNNLSNLQLRQGNHGNGVVMVCQNCGSHDIVAAPIGKEVVPHVA